MSNFETSAIRHPDGKTVIEIPSDDSDESDTGMYSISDRELDTTDVDKKPPNSSGVSSSESRLSSPPDTAKAANPRSTASPHASSPRCSSSVSRIVVGQCASDEEDLKQILKAARRTKARNALEEQIAPTSAPMLPPPDLSDRFQDFFGSQVKSKSSFFNSGQSRQPLKLQAHAAPHDALPDGTKDTSKHNAPHDPFTLNVDPLELPSRKRRRLDKMRHRTATNSRTSDIAPRQVVPGHASTAIASQGTKGQRPGAPGQGEGRRRQSSLPNIPMQSRSVSLDPTDTNTRRPEAISKQLEAPPNTRPIVTLPTLGSRQRSRAADKPGTSQRVVINIDEDDDTVQLPSTYPVAATSATRPTGAASRHGVNKSKKDRNCSGSGNISNNLSRQRSSGTQYPGQKASPDDFQERSVDLHGFIGGHPEKHPSYALKEANSSLQAVNRAKRRQFEYNCVRKRKPLDKNRSRHSRPSSNQAAEARLLRAQEALAWKEARSSSTQTALQNGTSGPKVSHSQRKTQSSQQPLFRPNKNAYQQPVLEDDEEDGDQRVDTPQFQSMFRPNPNAYRQPALEDENEHDFDDNDCPEPSELRSVPTSGPRAQRSQQLQTQTSWKPNRRTATQPALNDDNDLAGPQRNPLATNTSKASPQSQQQVRPMPQSVVLPTRSRNPPAHFSRAPKEDWDKVRADIMASTNQHRDNRRAMIVDSLPEGFGIPESREVSYARKSLANGRAKIDSFSDAQLRLDRRMRKRRSAIWRNVRKEFSDKPQDFQEEESQRRFDQYLEKTKALQPRGDASVSTAHFNADFLENGHIGKEAHDHQDVGLTARTIPASEALEKLGPSTIIHIYIVLVSKPYGDGKHPEYKRAREFGQLESARDYARSIVSDSAINKRVFSDVQSEIKDGYFEGRGKVFNGKGKGKWIAVKMQREQQMLGDLNDLPNIFVDGELVDKYRNGFDVFMSTTIPKCWRTTEVESPKKLALHKRQAEREQEARIRSHSTTMEGEEEEENPTGLEGDELRQALANLGSLDTSHTDADEEDADEEEAASDTASQASDDSGLSEGTIRSCSPAGDSYDRTPRNSTARTDHQLKRLGCFTELEAANRTALSAAKLAWKPRNANYDANIMWIETILPGLRQMEEDLGTKEFYLDFSDFGFGRVLNYQPWGFLHSVIVVDKRELQGPLDLPITYVKDLTVSSVVKDKIDTEPRAQSVAEVESVGEEDVADGVQRLDEESPDLQPPEEQVDLPDEAFPDRQSTDEEDISEEE